jgi:hypothetical protein
MRLKANYFFTNQNLNALQNISANYFVHGVLHKNVIFNVLLMKILIVNDVFYEANIWGCRKGTPPPFRPQCCAGGGVAVAIFSPKP